MYYKYPRTYHLPWRLGISSDDKILNDISCFYNMDIIVTLKMDGENTSMYSDKIHARSIDSKDHISRHWIKTFWNNIKYDIPDGYRICGENLYAKHSIKYENLKSYFYGFSIWNETTCLSWDDTLDFFSLLSIEPVEVIYEGIFDRNKLIELADNLDMNINEGYVIRNKNSFNYSDFSSNVAKFVRKNHVQSDVHWIHKEIELNRMSKITKKF